MANELRESVLIREACTPRTTCECNVPNGIAMNKPLKSTTAFAMSLSGTIGESGGGRRTLRADIQNHSREISNDQDSIDRAHAGHPATVFQTYFASKMGLAPTPKVACANVSPLARFSSRGPTRVFTLVRMCRSWGHFTFFSIFFAESGFLGRLLAT